MGLERPRRALGLGAQLVLIVSLLVSLVAGGMSYWRHCGEIDRGRAAREALIAGSVAPLVRELGEAKSIEQAKRAVMRHHQAHLADGNLRHHLRLVDPAGRVLIDTERGAAEATAGSAHPRFRVVRAIRTPALGSELAELTVSQDASDFERDVARRTRGFWVELALLLGSLNVAVLLAIHLLVVRPIRRLLQWVRKLELGYWSRAQLPAGAWELRWLGWRFHELTIELRRTMRLQLEAERRATVQYRRRQVGRSAGEQATAGNAHPGRLDQSLGAPPVGLCDARPPTEPPRAAVGSRGAAGWSSRPPPDALMPVASRITGLARQRAAWLAELVGTVGVLLAEHRLQVEDISYRVKQPASAWQKMRTKGLELDEIYDLFALRIVLASEADCYAVLGILHRHYEPVVERLKDYIQSPKPNGYQSLHTTLADEQGLLFEVQLRTAEMHRRAMYGPPAHLRYKGAQPARPPSPWPVGRLRGWVRRWLRPARRTAAGSRR